MVVQRIRDETVIFREVSTRIESLYSFAKQHFLDNIEFRCEIIMKKLNSGYELRAVNLNNLKTDLFADILGYRYYPLFDCSYIAPLPIAEYKVAFSIKSIDDHIFGGIINRKRPDKPISLAKPCEYDQILERFRRTVATDLSELKKCIDVGDYSYSVINLALTTFRSMHDTVLEANKQYIKELDQLIYGHFDDAFWEEFIVYDHLYEKNDKKDGAITYNSDFNVIGGAQSHADRSINAYDKTITIYPDPEEYVTEEFTYTFEGLVKMLYSQCRKLIDFLPALIQVESIINYRHMYYDDSIGTNQKSNC